MKLPINPNYADFPIFWFPLIAPLFLAALGVFGDLVGAQIATKGALEVIWEIAFSILKNINLAYVSIDIWALTEFTTAAAGRRLEGWQVWAYILAATIGLLFHMFSYLAAALLGQSTLGFLLGLVLVCIGMIGIMLIRVVVFQRIELRELSRL